MRRVLAGVHGHHPCTSTKGPTDIGWVIWRSSVVGGRALCANIAGGLLAEWSICAALLSPTVTVMTQLASRSAIDFVTVLKLMVSLVENRTAVLEVDVSCRTRVE